MSVNNQLNEEQSTEHRAVTNRIELGIQEGSALIFLLAGVFLFLCLVSYDANDPGWSHIGDSQIVQNWLGSFGAKLSDACFSLFGVVSYLFPFLFLSHTFQTVILRNRSGQIDFKMVALRALGGGVAVLSACALATMHFIETNVNSSGGILGLASSQGALSTLGVLGTTMIYFVLLLAGLTLSLGISWLNVIDKTGDITIGIAKWFAQKIRSYRLKRVEINNQKTALEQRKSNVEIRIAEQPKRKEPPRIAPLKPKAEKSVRIELEKQSPLDLFEETSKPEGELPSLGLLHPADNDQTQGYSAESLEAMSRLLEIKLKDFGVSVEVVSVAPGPVITRFEIQPAPGVKASKISGLSQDLARSLAMVSVRVVEVIAGKTVLGIEVPNEHRAIVRLSEVLETKMFDEAKSHLTIALGHDISGAPVIADVAKMPHLLVAGTTGSGKSVGVNTMLCSLLYKSTPEDLRLILVDPKMLELAIYEGIPHLLTPVITDMKDAANGLRWAVGEMERRYKLMSKVGVRNMAGLNKKIVDSLKNGEPLKDPLWDPAQHIDGSVHPILVKLPSIVIVIDEFADMMMMVGKKVEELIARIAQKARAAGIHLILATQRPSVDVITGLIKANVPTRMAFQVSSKIDSRTILDQGGAEQLLGHGDMLYLPPGSGLPIRVHGAFVDDDEVHRIVDDWKQRGRPDYIDEILAGDAEEQLSVAGIDAAPRSEDPEADALFDEAIAFVTTTRKVSISSVQRKLRIGYNRAANLVEAMEAAGVITGPGHNGSREVIAPAPVEF
ncbi:DNA translocase FtsK [Marinicellulosiphila megalodicopiae]|uniref:DNA translocase FtsK n=1 Tax=Marinicellulosiphila megalodicopiae TaxID=2724896 RepID=UPI003BB0C8B2